MELQKADIDKLRKKSNSFIKCAKIENFLYFQCFSTNFSLPADNILERVNK